MYSTILSLTLRGKPFWRNCWQLSICFHGNESSVWIVFVKTIMKEALIRNILMKFY